MSDFSNDISKRHQPQEVRITKVKIASCHFYSIVFTLKVNENIFSYDTLVSIHFLDAVPTANCFITLL